MKLRQRLLALLLASAMALCTAACGNSTETTTETDTSATEGTQEDTTAAEETDAAESEADMNAVLQEAIANVKASTGAQTEWYGPTEGPVAAKNQSIVVINANSANPSEAAWGEAVKTACDRIGWEKGQRRNSGSFHAGIS